MALGEVLYEPGGRLRHVYFPVTSIVSLLYVMEDGASAEIAIVGNEGILGISLFMGGETTPSRAVVQSAGYGLRLKAQLLKQEFARFGPMMHLLLRYTQALITQMAQTAVCNRHHSVDQQLCRWLLLSLDRLASNELTMTQELIANMLGVRREGVTEAAGKLQDAGLINYRRGRITVLDRKGLEARSLRVLRGGQEGIRSPSAIRGQVISRTCGQAGIASSARAFAGLGGPQLVAIARIRRRHVEVQRLERLTAGVTDLVAIVALDPTTRGRSASSTATEPTLTASWTSASSFASLFALSFALQFASSFASWPSWSSPSACAVPWLPLCALRKGRSQ